LNNQYLNTGSKLTQLALAELPENDEELKRKILDALGDTDKATRKNVVRNMMASVKDARRGRGGSKKHKYLKGKKQENINNILNDKTI